MAGEVYGFSESVAGQLVAMLGGDGIGASPNPAANQLNCVLMRVTASAMSGATPGTGTGRMMRLDQVSTVWTVVEVSPIVDSEVINLRKAALSSQVVLVSRDRVTNQWVVC